MTKQNIVLGQTGPYHDFWLIPLGERAFSNYDDLLPIKDGPLRISDDVLRRFGDYFRWIKTHNPSGPDQQGFNLFGPSVIDAASEAMVLKTICDGLLTMFSVAPEKISLTGDYCIDTSDPNEEGRSEIVEVEKPRSLEALEWLKCSCECVLNGKHYILHLGI